MTNHVHILATSATPFDLSHMMQDTGRKYVRYINHSYKRTGTLWEGRYKASLVYSEMYLLTCMRYIELNPVRANMVSYPGDYAWSSYLHNARGKTDKLIQQHPVYQFLDRDFETRLTAYRELFKVHMDSSQILEVREVLNRELVLGRNDFKEKIEEMTIRQTWPGVVGRPRVSEESAIYYVL